MNARDAVKEILGRLALAPIAASRTRASLEDRVNVIYLHYVGDRRPYYDDFYSDSTIDRFDHDLAILERHFEFCTLREVVTDGAPGGAPPRLALTFDDGFDLIGSGVADLLERYGVRATSFVVTSTIGNANLMWRNKLSAICAICSSSTLIDAYNELARMHGLHEIARHNDVMPASELWPMEVKEELGDELWQRCALPPLDAFLAEHRPYFTWEGLESWINRGHDIGLHTATHPFCSRISVSAVDEEIVRPAALLRERFGLDFLPFSYPFGERLPEAIERRLYEEGVYDCAFGIMGFARRGTPPYRLERAPAEGELRFPVFGKAFLAHPA